MLLIKFCRIPPFLESPYSSISRRSTARASARESPEISSSSSAPCSIPRLTRLLVMPFFSTKERAAHSGKARDTRSYSMFAFTGCLSAAYASSIVRLGEDNSSHKCVDKLKQKLASNKPQSLRPICGNLSLLFVALLFAPRHVRPELQPDQVFLALMWYEVEMLPFGC